MFIGTVDGRFGSARDAAAAAAAGAVAGVWFEAVRIALDPDHRKNDNRRRFGICVDIAATRTSRIVGKLDDFAHFSPLSRTRRVGTLN